MTALARKESKKERINSRMIFPFKLNLFSIAMFDIVWLSEVNQSLPPIFPLVFS